LNHRILAPALATLCAFSGAAEPAEQWIGPANIVNVYPHEGGLIFYLDGPEVSFSTCGFHRFSIPLINANYKVDAAGIYLAFASQKKVTIHLPSDAPACEPAVDRFQIHGQ
jgi:hypothetical protein